MPALRARRIRRLMLGRDWMCKFFQAIHAGKRVSLDEWPADAEVVGFTDDMRCNSVCVYVESETFEPVEDGHEIPVFNPVMTIHWHEATE